MSHAHRDPASRVLLRESLRQGAREQYLVFVGGEPLHLDGVVPAKCARSRQVEKDGVVGVSQTAGYIQRYRLEGLDGRRAVEGDDETAACRRGQIAQAACGALHQAHHLDGPGGGHEELPSSRAVAQATAQAGTARFELLRAERPRSTGRHGEPHITRGPRLPVVVASGDRHRDVGVGSVGHPQPAPLQRVALGDEDRDVVLDSAFGVAPGAHDRVHRGEEPVRHPDVGRRLDVERRGQLQAPVPLPVAESPAQPRRRVAGLEIAGVEVPGLARLQAEGSRAMSRPGVVNAGDAHGAGSTGVVDNPGETVLSMPRGTEQRKGVALLRGECPGDAEADLSDRLPTHDILLRTVLLVEIPTARRAPAAVRGAEVLRQVLPRAAAQSARAAAPPHRPRSSVRGRP